MLLACACCQVGYHVIPSVELVKLGSRVDPVRVIADCICAYEEWGCSPSFSFCQCISWNLDEDSGLWC